ncbi:MAG: hypothetical protein HN975_01485 [Anaerolineae bacterium]|jgi:hypothetical protein|nr:hypothetical protein [Anaerolineae bacterium]
MGRGRKPKEGVRHKYDIRLYLWEGEDDDLISFLESIPSRQRPSGLKLALRSGGALADLEATDIENEDDDIDFDFDDFIS